MRLTAHLLEAGLLDEPRILVNPVLLADGQRLATGNANVGRLSEYFRQANPAYLRAVIEATGAVVMGPRSFDMADGSWRLRGG